MNAAIFGIEYAINYDLEIGIVEVIEFSAGNIDAGILPLDIEKENQTKAKTNIDQLKSLFPNIKITEFEPIGKPVKEINKIIKRNNIDMLIIGHQIHNFWHKLFDQNIEHLLMQNIEIPLLLVPEPKN